MVPLEQCKSVRVDLPENPRKNKVRLPSCILTSKPRSVPNQQVEPRKPHLAVIALFLFFVFYCTSDDCYDQAVTEQVSVLTVGPPGMNNAKIWFQFLSVQEPVRRRCRTISLANPDTVLRGFQLAPPSVDFGTLQEGTTATVVVRMRNVGVDTCRYKIQPTADAQG